MKSVVNKGFTLVELVVVIAIIALLSTGLILVINPLGQVDKLRNNQRVQDLSTIATGLDLYYNDKNCYPKDVPLGEEWSSSNTVYMKKVPNDPQASKNGDYIYMTDTSSNCPQWNVIFSKLVNDKSDPEKKKCNLPPECLPSGWNSQWACKSSGTLDCATVTSEKLPDVSLVQIPTLTPTPFNNRGSTGAFCAVRNSNLNNVYTLNGLEAPDLGLGYARELVSTENHQIYVNDNDFSSYMQYLISLCTESIYESLMNSYCTINNNPAKWEIVAYSQYGNYVFQPPIGRSAGLVNCPGN
jgi:prepilin-type N-terminal cleavage/methylation domain-containing protein